MARGKETPVVLITGAGGGIASVLGTALKPRYRLVGMDLRGKTASIDCIAIDLTSDDSVELAFRKFRERFGARIAAVVHLAAYFDFSGEENALYQKVNEEGTRRLLRALQAFDVGQFVYASTMLVHTPRPPGERVSETTPIAPKWAYPQSKARAEAIVAEERGGIPCAILRLAGVYDDRTAVPTLSQQISRIYERDLKSHIYSGETDRGQAFVHADDAVDAIRRTIDRRAGLSEDAVMLVGEPDVMTYEQLQSTVGRLIHGESDWATVSVPKAVAKAGAWIEEQSEPIVPDAVDQGEKPFIRPFMVEMAEDHYALDVTRARELLDWSPRRKIHETLPAIIAALMKDPVRWYAENGITPPDWLCAAATAGRPANIRSDHERQYRARHQRYLWAPFSNIGLGTWLITSPAILGYAGTPLAWSDIASGTAVAAAGALSLSWRYGWARWVCGIVGIWLLFAPLVFWTTSAAAYLNGTLVGIIVIAFAALVPPIPGISPSAAPLEPVRPPGWDLSPSSWLQRLPIILLAVVGFHISRYLAAYQLGHVDGVWEPFFMGGPDRKNGTEEIITSSVSQAWPVPDAGLGAVTYALEILTGVMGAANRWRTMPWLVVLFGIMIVPLGAVSITFIIIQPILIGTWCTLCLIAAAAMLLQIPYSLDELVATGQFLLRRKRRGQNLLRVFFVGDTDEKDGQDKLDDFERSPIAITRDMFTGGVSLPWNLALCLAVGVWLMFTRLTLGVNDGLANAEHLIGSLVLTITVSALAEVARPLRFLNMGFGVALMIVPFAYGAAWLPMASDVICGVALVGLSIRRGSVRHRFGEWTKFIV